MSFIAAQSNTIANALQAQFNWEPIWVGGVLVSLIAVVIWQNVKTMSSIAAVVVPIMAMFYLGIASYITLSHIENLPAIFALIIKSAFGIQEVASGAAAFAVSSAVTHGVERGLFSNEAGMGSSANIAASVDAKGRSPVEQGFIQMAGIVVDTLIICSATAFMILSTHSLSADMGMSGVRLIQDSMSMHFGAWGGLLVTMPFFLLIHYFG